MAEIGRIGIIGGAGWLGSGIAAALLKSGLVRGEALVCSYRSGKPGPGLGCRWTGDNAEFVAASDIVILSVRSGGWRALFVRPSRCWAAYDKACTPG